MVKAQKRNAVLTEKFWFRNDLQDKDNKSYSLSKNIPNLHAFSFEDLLTNLEYLYLNYSDS